MSVLKEVQLKNFRKFKNNNFSLKEGINIIYGKNGSGKTSFMESIYLLNYGKSFRTKRIAEILNGEDFFASGRIEGRMTKHLIRFYYKDNKKRLLMDERRVGISSIMEKFFSLYFNGNMIDNIFKFRKEGRRVIDMFCSGIEPLYLKELLKYNRILKSRNKLLKSIKKEDINYKVWTEKLESQGRILNTKRKKILEEMNKILLEKSIKIYLEKISFNKDNLFNLEKKYRRSIVGPHVDYIKFYKENKELSIFGSTGINKTVFFEIIKSFVKIYNEEKGSSPFLMLDDFDSDLDYDNLKRYVSGFESQVILSFVNKRYDFIKKFNVLEVQ